MIMTGFFHARTIVSVPSFEDFFHSDRPARDKFLSRLFGLFSEDVVRHWCRCPEAPYEDLGRPYLRLPTERYGHTLDFTLRDRETGATFVAELKCELEYDSYRYLRLMDASHLGHHQGAALQKAARSGNGLLLHPGHGWRQSHGGGWRRTDLGGDDTNGL